MVSHTADKMPARQDDGTETTEAASAEMGDDSGRGNMMGDTASSSTSAAADFQGVDGGGVIIVGGVSNAKDGEGGYPSTPQSQNLGSSASGSTTGDATTTSASGGGGAGTGGGGGGGGGKPLFHPQRHNLKNRFDLLRTLGEGTYGKVKLACERSTGEQVAIKYVKKTKIRDETDLTRIRREISILSTLRHPNIVNIRQVFEKKDRIVLVMDCALGGELYDYLNTKRNLPETETRRIFRQIAGAMHYIHKNNIVHRDLKLENIIMDTDGSIKIADFGLANYYSLDKTLRTFCGSPLYASPEIVNGKPYHGPEVDVWSLGVVLYTLSYGAMPFESSNLKVLRQQISTGQYPEPAHPCAAASLIRHMLTVNPARRATLSDILTHWWVNLGHDLCPDGSQYRPAVDNDTTTTTTTSNNNNNSGSGGGGGFQAGSLFSPVTGSDLHPHPHPKVPPPGLHRVPGARCGGKAKVVETSFDEDEMLYDIGTSSSSAAQPAATSNSSATKSASSGSAVPTHNRATVAEEQSPAAAAAAADTTGAAVKTTTVGGMAEQWRQTIASGIEEIRTRVVQSLAGHQDENHSTLETTSNSAFSSTSSSSRWRSDDQEKIDDKEENKVTVIVAPPSSSSSSTPARVSVISDHDYTSHDSATPNSATRGRTGGSHSPSEQLLMTLGDSTEDESSVFDPQTNSKTEDLSGSEGDGGPGHALNQRDNQVGGSGGDGGEADKPAAVTATQKPRRGILKRKGKFSGGDSGCCVIMTDEAGPNNNKSLDEEDGKSPPLPPPPPPHPPPPPVEDPSLQPSPDFPPSSSQPPSESPVPSFADGSASQSHHHPPPPLPPHHHHHSANNSNNPNPVLSTTTTTGSSRVLVELPPSQPPHPPPPPPPSSSISSSSSSSSNPSTSSSAFLPPCLLHRPVAPHYYSSYAGSSASGSSTASSPHTPPDASDVSHHSTADSSGINSSSQSPGGGGGGGVDGQGGDSGGGGSWVHPPHFYTLSVATGSGYSCSESAFVIPNAVCTCPVDTDATKVVRRRKGILKNSSARNSLLDDARKRLSLGSLSSNSSADILDLSYDSSDGSDSNIAGGKTPRGVAGASNTTVSASTRRNANGISLQPGDRNSFSLDGEFTAVPLDGIPNLGRGGCGGGGGGDDNLETNATNGDPPPATSSPSSQQPVFHDNVFDFSEAKQVLQKALNFVN